jgi:hypothetical protein
VEGYIPILGFFAGFLFIIVITGRNSEAAIGGAGGVLKRQKRQVRAVHGCHRAAKNSVLIIFILCFFRYFEKKQPGHSERRIKRPGKFPCKVIYR